MQLGFCWRKIEDKKTIVDNIIVKGLDTHEHELEIKFKLPYVNDEFIYKDNKDKSKGYILTIGKKTPRVVFF